MHWSFSELIVSFVFSSDNRMVTVFSGTSVISFRESMQITIIPCSCRAKPKDSISFPETPKVLESNTTAMWPVSNKRRSNIPENSLTEESSFPEITNNFPCCPNVFMRSSVETRDFPSLMRSQSSFVMVDARSDSST